MVRVAIAGSTGGLGRTVVEAIVADGKHKVFALTRQETQIFDSQPEVTVLKIDFSSPEKMAKDFDENSIDTIISCINFNNEGEEANQAQLNLIEGAATSSTVTRFAPSEFGIDYVKAAKENYHFHAIQFKNAAIQKLQATHLAYTRFIIGMYMDYLGPPQAPSHLGVISLILDPENNRAAIPGDGSDFVVFTHSTDVARFVTAALSLREWPEASFICGDKIKLNEAVSVAESVKGCKFEVAYDEAPALKSGKNTELPANMSRYGFLPKALIDGIAQTMGLAVIDGWLSFDGPFLNDLYSEVKPMSVEAFLSKYYGKESVWG